MAEKQKSNFPRGFFWGASTSSYQVEGGNHTQWTVWELAHAAELARSAQDRYAWLPNWHEIAAQATRPQNYVSGRAVEHYKYYRDDFVLAKSLNLNAFRFGIEWARVEPKEGKWDEAAWEHYRVYVKELRRQGLEPFLNIWHWTMPVWFTEKGGFEKRKNLVYFKRYVTKIMEELGNDVRYILTINEPNVYAGASYIERRWPPQEFNPLKMIQVFYNLAKAHRIAYKVIKRHYPAIQVGVATQLGNIQAKRPHNIIDQVVTKWMRYSWNWWYLNRIRRYQDFVGFNYYFTDYYYRTKRENPTVPLNDMGWYMEPEGLYALLIRVATHYKKPIIITENGLADAKDQHRQWWLEETILAIERALSEGVQVHGYFHWSLLDNFEWADGWWPKFGLVEVNRRTFKRTPRPSALWYAEKIEQIEAPFTD